MRQRVDVWLDPFGDEGDTSYQIAQSLYGFASGGMFGSGLGQGYPQLVPYAKSDFIIAAFGEEIGLIGVVAMLVLYAIIVRARHAHRDRVPRHLRHAARRRPRRSCSRSRCSWSSAASRG